MGWTIFNIAINCFQAYMILLFATKGFSCRPHTKIYDFLLLLSCSTFFSLFLFFPLPAIDIAVFLFPLAFSLVFSTDSYTSIVYWNVVIALGFALIAGLANHIYFLLLQITNTPFSTNCIRHVIYILLSNAALLLLTQLIIKQKSTDESPRFSTHFPFLLMIIALFLSEESLYYYQKIVSNSESGMFFPLMIYCGLTICTFLSILLFHTVSLNALKESRYQAELSLYSQSKQHYEELEKSYAQLVAYRHDIRHHLQTLEQLVSHGHMTDAQNYLSSMQCVTTKKFFITGCSAVDALLAAKNSTMESYDISFRYTAHPLSDLPIDTVDFCSIVGNLLDNSIEGILRIADYSSLKPTVHLSFLKTGDMFYINCENPCNPSSLIIRKGKFITSKKSEHQSGLRGIGLSSIQRIAEQAEGRCQFYCENQVFYAQVVLPYLSTAVMRKK